MIDPAEEQGREDSTAAQRAADAKARAQREAAAALLEAIFSAPRGGSSRLSR
jgi:hypothetical protein